MKPYIVLGLAAATALAGAQIINSDQSDIRVPLPGQSGGTTLANSPAATYPITFTVSGVGAIGDLNIILNFGTRVSTSTTVGGADDFAGREHTFAGDMDMLLVGPTGLTCFFMSDAGSSNNLRGRYIFDDEAAGLMSSTVVGTSNDPVANGSYQVSAYTPTETFLGSAPAGPYGSSLSVFDGSNANGTWSLYILDDASGDWGWLDNASLDFAPVPEPATMVVLGLGLAAVARRRRRK